MNKRAWVVQERLLAPRIVYFGSKQVFWEYNQVVACEALPEGDFHCAVAAGMRLKSWRDRTEIFTVHRQTKGAYKSWWDILWEYSQCALTVESDKLIALSGIDKENGGNPQGRVPGWTLEAHPLT